MALKYEEWLARTGRPRTAESALQWKRTHGAALGKYDSEGNAAFAQPGGTTTGPPQYSAPSYAPGALDTQAITEVGNLDRYRSINEAEAERNYQQQVAEINASRALADYNAQQGMTDVGRNAAARGVSRSGIRKEGEGKVQAQRLREESSFDLAAKAAANSRKGQLDRGEADYQTGRSGSLGAFGERDYSRWMDQNPVATEGPGAGVPGAPRVASRTSPGTVPAAKRNLSFAEFKKVHPGIRQDSVMRKKYATYSSGR
jgi:hypothetical protein